MLILNSMDLEEIKCPLCGKFYDEENHLPQLLPDCGHSFCSQCISASFQLLGDSEEEKEAFLCPEDQ